MGELVCMNMAVPDLDSACKAFEALGFELDADGTTIQLGRVRLVLDPRRDPPHGLVGWGFRGSRDEVLKLDPAAAPPTTLLGDVSSNGAATHPNGVVDIDHVVVMVPALEAAVAGLEGYVGAQCRRQAEMRGHMMAFVRAGSTTIELVEVREQDVPQMWGIALEVSDLDATIAAIRDSGGSVGNPTPAIQGGRIAASPPEASFGMSIAYIEPGA